MCTDVQRGKGGHCHEKWHVPSLVSQQQLVLSCVPCLCDQVNINSLVDVVRKYIALAEERTEGARQQSHQTVLDIDDLDLPDSPERLESGFIT